MKRFACHILIFTMMLCLSSCTVPIKITGEDSADRISEISEQPEEYLGKTIYTEGRYAYEEFMGDRYHYVMVTDPEEENVGFEIRGEIDYPEAGTKIAVTGELRAVLEYGNYCIYLQVSEFEALPVE